MTFATSADLEARLGARELLGVADRDRDGVADVAVIAAALQDADAEIVSLLAGTVVIDPASPPYNLVRLATDIATYRLYRGNPTEDVRNRYLDAVKQLRLVAEGKASLDGGPAAPTTVPDSPRAAASKPGTRIFTRGLQ